MKFVVSSGELLGRLQAVGRVISGKSPLPILDNFLFTIAGNTLTITAADTEIIMTTTLEVSSEGSDGQTAVPGGKLTEFLKKLPEQPVTFTINDESYAIEISTASGNNNQVGLSAEEFPTLPQLAAESTQTLSMDAGTLLTGISKAAFATGNDELRPIMGGILFDIEPDRTTFVATDSHKLVRYQRTDVNAGFTSSFILNKKPAALLKGILNRNDGVIKIDFDSKYATFTLPNYVLVCRLLDGMFPQYRSVIPTDNPFRLIVNRTDLLNSIGRVSLFADGSSLVKFELSSNSVRVMAQDLDFSCSATETVPCTYEGEEMSIGFKANFFTDILSNIESTDIRIELSDPSRAGLVFPAEKKDNEDELMLLMPMKI